MLRAEVKHWKNPGRVGDTSAAAFSFFIMCSKKKKSGTLAIANGAAVITASALGAELGCAIYRLLDSVAACVDVPQRPQQRKEINQKQPITN